MSDMAKKPRLRWKREPQAKGLYGITQGELGCLLMYGDTEIIRTDRKRPENAIEGRRYFWYGGNEGLGIPRRNTSREPVSTVEEAKAQAMEHVRKHLKAGKRA